MDLLTALVAVVCDKMPLLAPTEATITLSTTGLVLPVDGSADIIATVSEQSGTPVHNGTVVTFTSTLGTIEPREGRTNGGKVTVALYTGSRSGTATVSAVSGSARAEDLTIEIGAQVIGTILLTVSPGPIPSTGGTVQLVATVHDTSGNLMPGVPVTFTADAGTLGSSTVITDANGEAQTTLTTDRETAVTANAGGLSASATVGSSTPLNVNLTADQRPATVDEAVVFTATVTGSDTPIASYVWDFGEGTKLTTSGNEVTHVYSEADTVVVKVSVINTDGISGSTQIRLVVAELQVEISLEVSPPNPSVGQPVTFTATVTPPTVVVQRYDWLFGDGNSLDNGGRTTIHSYGSTGAFTVRVTATLSDGSTVTTQALVTVQP